MGKIEYWLSGRRPNLEHLIYYLIILFLPTQLGRHFWPSFSYIYGIRVDYLSPTLYITDVLIILLFAFWLINNTRNLSFEKLIGALADLLKTKSFLLLLPFLIIAGIVVSKNQMAGWYGIIKLIEFGFIGYYTSVFINKKRFKKILIIFSITLIFESLIAVFQFINQGSLGGLLYFLGERSFNGQTPGIANASLNGNLVLRPYATFSHPNVLSGFLLISMILILYNLITKNKFLLRMFAFSLIVGSISLFLSMSRVAILLWLVIVTTFIFRTIGQKNKYGTLYLLIVLAIFFGIFFTPLGSRFLDLSFSDPVIKTRLDLIKNSVFLIIQNPIFGVGINNSISELSLISMRDNIFYFQPVHNIFLLIALQVGLSGLLFFLWFIIRTYRNLRFTIYDLRFTILSCILILGFFDHYFLTLQQGQLLFSFALGLCWAKCYNI
ncbi:MAG: O-antigen ligase family protein [Candidatus Levybacteria bacterium]|nr:O-antigen ligase family protein [Candidatus Levybacteria bacterium]